MSSFLKDHLERNYVSVMAGQYESRKSYVEQIPHVGRKLEIAMLELCARKPMQVGSVLGLSLPDDARYAGAGSIHTVIKSQGYVGKIHRASADMNPHEQEKLAEKNRVDHTVLSRYLGSMVLPQKTEVINHPLRQGKRAVVSAQSSIGFKDTGIFNAYSNSINRDALETTLAEYPGIESALDDLVKGSTKLFTETSMLVDVSGQNNIVIAGQNDNHELVCMDGLPIDNPNQGDIDRIMGQITELQVAIR